MKIADGWLPWQARLAGISMAWWLALAPDVLLWACRRSGIDLSPGARGWLEASYVMLLLGVVQALLTAGAGESPRPRCVAWWFLLGALLSPIAIVVGRAWM